MERIAITRDEFDEFRRLQIRYRWDWPAVFSTNYYSEIWPWVTYGYTPGANREPVRGLSPIVDAVADEYLRVRPEGGRFFINERGAFYKDADGVSVQFASFRICG